MSPTVILRCTYWMCQCPWQCSSFGEGSVGPGPEGLVTPYFAFSPRAVPTAETPETCPTWWIASRSSSSTLQPQEGEEDERYIKKHYITSKTSTIYKSSVQLLSVRYDSSLQTLVSEGFIVFLYYKYFCDTLKDSFIRCILKWRKGVFRHLLMHFMQPVNLPRPTWTRFFVII